MMHILHDWKPVAATIRLQPVSLTNPLTSIVEVCSENIVSPRTDILWKCQRCTKVKSTAIHGRWTLDQIKAVDNKVGEKL